MRESAAVDREIVLPGAGMAVRRFDISADRAVSLWALAIDALLIIVTSLGTGISYHRLALGSQGDLVAMFGTGAIVAATFGGITRIGAAEPLRLSTALGRARSAITAWTSTFLLLALVAFSLKISDTFSRGAVFSFFLTGLGVVTASRVFVPRALVRLNEARAYRGIEPIVIAGAASLESKLFMDELRRQGCSKIHVVEIAEDCRADAWADERKRVVDRARSVARSAGRGMIYVAAPALDRERAASIVAGLRLVPRAVCVVPDATAAQLLRYAVKTIGASVALEVQREPMSGSQRFVKRTIDIVFASLAILVLSPVFLALTLLIRLDSPGPAMFRQTRNGIGGRPFRIFKFRTMHVMEDGEQVRQAGRDDARVTRVGRYLRPTSLDELPQLFNVFNGEMSLVGPRPHAVAHDQHYAALIENYELRQHVKPGLTGWAQVNGCRGATPTVDLMYRRIEFDLWYAANASLSLDFLIVVRTLPALLGQRNAY